MQYILLIAMIIDLKKGKCQAELPRKIYEELSQGIIVKRYMKKVGGNARKRRGQILFAAR